MFALDAGGLALHLRRLQPVTQALLRSRNNSPPRLEPLPRQVLHHVGGFLAVHAEPGVRGALLRGRRFPAVQNDARRRRARSR